MSDRNQQATRERNTKSSGKTNCDFCGEPLLRKEIFEGLTLPILCECPGSVNFREEEQREIARQLEEKEERMRMERAKRLLEESCLGERFASRVFSTFKVTQENREAYEASVAFVEDFRAEETKGRGIIFVGNVGTGKTHLSAAIVNELVRKGYPCIFGNVTALLGRLRQSFDGNGENEAAIMKKYCEASLLVIDDLGKEKTSEWVQEKLYALINHRYEHYLKTIITTNDQFATLEKKIGEAAISRLIEMCDGYKLGGSDYRKKCLN